MRAALQTLVNADFATLKNALFTFVFRDLDGFSHAWDNANFCRPMT